MIDGPVSRLDAESEQKDRRAHAVLEVARSDCEAQEDMSYWAGRSWALECITCAQLGSFRYCERPDASCDLHLRVNAHIRTALADLGLETCEVDFFQFRRGVLSIRDRSQYII